MNCFFCITIIFRGFIQISVFFLYLNFVNFINALNWLISVNYDRSSIFGLNLFISFTNKNRIIHWTKTCKFLYYILSIPIWVLFGMLKHHLAFTFFRTFFLYLCTTLFDDLIDGLYFWLLYPHCLLLKIIYGFLFSDFCLPSSFCWWDKCWRN